MIPVPHDRAIHTASHTSGERGGPRMVPCLSHHPTTVAGLNRELSQQQHQQRPAVSGQHRSHHTFFAVSLLFTCKSGSMAGAIGSDRVYPCKFIHFLSSPLAFILLARLVAE